MMALALADTSARTSSSLFRGIQKQTRLLSASHPRPDGLLAGLPALLQFFIYYSSETMHVGVRRLGVSKLDYCCDLLAQKDEKGLFFWFFVI